MEVLKVSSHSSPNSVAGAIAGVIREKKMVEVQAVGAGAANQIFRLLSSSLFFRLDFVKSNGNS